jgi:hypothetical protein
VYVRLWESEGGSMVIFMVRQRALHVCYAVCTGEVKIVAIANALPPESAPHLRFVWHSHK